MRTNGLVWFRRDLRCDDHAALHHALSQCERVWCVFVFDMTILAPLQQRGGQAQSGYPLSDRRVEFILACVGELDTELRQRGGGLIVLHADPREAIPALASDLNVDAVYANRDYEPAAIERDAFVHARLHEAGREFFGFKDQVVFEKDDILTGQGKPYSVFTPYRSAWLKNLTPAMIEPFAMTPRQGQLSAPAEHWTAPQWPNLASLGFSPGNFATLNLAAGMSGAAQLIEAFANRIDRYAAQRDFPSVKGPSYLSAHLRFGTVSIRSLVRMAHAYSLQPQGQGATVWLSELIWREFFFMILAHHPRLANQASFRPECDAIRWETGPAADEAFDAWCKGRTGYPLVDAGMRQLAQTGYMHNRLRMVTASFLVKDLGIDWRRGEQFFADYLNDFDFAANNGGWQWAASTGCDAQPWFRIFNPVTQSRRYDPEGRFIKRYVPELAGAPIERIHAPWAGAGAVSPDIYPHPIVDHSAARVRTLARFAAVSKPLSPR